MMKMRLRSGVEMLSPPRTNEISDEGCSANKVPDKKYPLNEKYNLRIRGKVDTDKKLLKNDLKKLSNKKFVDGMNTDNSTKASAIQEKEKLKKRSKRQVERLSYSPEIKNSSPVKRSNFGEIKDRNEITGILNVDKKSSGKKCITRKKNIQGKILNDKVPLSEISNDNPKAESEQKNVLVSKIGAVSENIVKHEAKFSIWRKKLNERRSTRGIKRKSFVDVYDISQDEDILSSATKHMKENINSKKLKNMKRCANKKNDRLMSNKNLKINQKYTSNTKPVQNRLIKLKSNHQTHTVNSIPEKKVSNTHFSSDKKLDVIQTSVDENRQNCILTTVEVDVNITPENIVISDPEINMNNNFSLDKKSNIIQTSVVDEKEQDCICIPPDVNITLEHIDNEHVPTEQDIAKKSLVDKTSFLLDLADEFEKSLLLPRMTSTPHTTLLIQHGAIPLEVSKIPVLGLSDMISKDRKCLKLPVKIHSSVPRNEADITLFESPVKKSRTKKPAVSRSPKKNVHINLFKDFTELSSAENLEDSVLKPNKAYHSPDNFKTHLVRAKRISEVMNTETKRSKDELMMEQMQQHFDEISGTELCVE